MHVIAAACLKGGPGKSTIASTLGAVLHQAQKRTLIVDTDPQRTLTKWAAIAAEHEVDGPPVVSVDGASLRRDLARIARGFQVVVIDCPPRLGKETRAALLEASLVLVPLNPGAGDLWALQETAELVEAVREVRPELVALAVLNRATERHAVTRAVREQAARMMPLLPAQLANRVAFAEAMGRGEAVTTYEPGGRADEEARALTAAVVHALRRAAP